MRLHASCCQAELRRPSIAQPAILVHSVAVWRILCHELGYQSAADSCSAVMGHSLGEFTALCVSGALSLADAVQLVVSTQQHRAHYRVTPHNCKVLTSIRCL